MTPLSTKTWSKLTHHLKGLEPVSLVLDIDNHDETKIYSPGSVVSGRVEVTTARDFAFEAFNIDFTGESSTAVQTSYGDPRHSRHVFLKLAMPLAGSVLPESRTLEAYTTYTIPFTFTIPYHLPSKACKHSGCEAVRERHLYLPPSMGYWEGKDQAPNAAKIDYGVKVKLTPRSGKNGKQGKPITTHRIVKVLPTQPAAPTSPLISEHTKHPLTKYRPFHRDLLSHKAGNIKVSTAAPEPIVLANDGSQVSETVLKINVEFTPKKGEVALPEIHTKSLHVEAHTHYSFTHVDFFPDREDKLGSLRAVIPFYTSHKATVQPSDNLVWKPHSESLFTRRDSGAELGDSSDEGSVRKTSDANGSQPTHIATLSVPVTLPTGNKRFFLPSFYSCLISRTYNLRVVLGAGSLASTIVLNVPLEVVIECPEELNDRLPNYAQIDLEEAIPLEILPSYTP